MDLYNILLMASVYWILAFIIWLYLNYFKYLNVAVAANMILIAYILYIIIIYQSIPYILIVLLVLIFVSCNILITKLFKSIVQRQLFSLLFTLALSRLIENVIFYYYGFNSISFEFQATSILVLGVIFLLLLCVIVYLLKYSYYARVLKAYTENESVTKVLGLNTTLIGVIVWLAALILLLFVSYLLLSNGNIRAGDWFFYLIKALGILLLVGVASNHYVLIGALLYTVLEYSLFVTWGLPIAYKDSLILLIILAVLLIRPQGLFTLFSTRKL